MKKYEMRFVLIAIAVTILISIWTCIGNKQHEWQVDEIYIRYGDTLWGFAEVYCPEDMDIREWIHEVKKLNNRKTAEIYEGEIIKILKEMKK